MKPILNPSQREVLVLLIIILSPLFWRGVGGEAFGQTLLQKEQHAGDPKPFYTRISGGSAISFYSNNNFHTTNTRPGAAFYGNVSEEILIYKDLYFVGGLEYQHSALSFNSYYIAPGYQTLYNQQYAYNYKLALQEGRLDLLLRLIGGNELRDKITAYVETGYVLRCLINTKMKVTDDGNGEILFNRTTYPYFVGRKIANSFSSGLKVNLGVQHNFLRTHRAVFIQVGLMYGLAQFLIHESFTPSSLLIKSTYLQFGLGYKF